MSINEQINQMYNMLYSMKKINNRVIGEEQLDEVKDLVEEYIPLHEDWLKEGNKKNCKALESVGQIDSEGLSQFIVGIHNLCLDLEDLCEVLQEVSEELDKSSSETIE